MKLQSILFSSLGNSRNINEDNFCFDLVTNNNDMQKEIMLEVVSSNKIDFALFDGMGGMKDGAVASKMAANYFYELVKQDKEIQADDLSTYYHLVNDGMCQLMRDNKRSRLGTTAVTLSINNIKLLYSNIGDSKLYRVRDNKINQLSYDHTEIRFLIDEGFITPEQAKTHPSANKLTQHLGIFPEEFLLDPFIKEDTVLLDDIYLLSTDGLTNYLSIEAIFSILSVGSIRDALEQMIKRVYAGGASDNFTFIIVKVGE